MNVLQREFWNGPPEQLRVLCKLQKPNGLRAEIVVWSNPLGFEVRLFIDTSLIRSQVVRDPGEIDGIANEWRVAMTEKGWS